MNKKILILAILAAIILGSLLYSQKSLKKTVPIAHSNLGNWNPNLFYDPINTKHFLTSTPKHGQTFNSLPETVSLTFDTPLQEGSYLKAEVWDENYIEGGESGVSFSPDKKTMTGKIEHNAITGMYVVMYTACFQSESCQDGYYRFLVDPNKK